MMGSRGSTVKKACCSQRRLFLISQCKNLREIFILFIFEKRIVFQSIIGFFQERELLEHHFL